MSDLISRQDAIKAVRKKLQDWGSYACEDYRRGLYEAQDIIDALPSVEPEQTVIRSKTFMPTKDFKEWAERIRDVNPNAVVIPCDAEVVSAEAEEHRIYKDGYNTGKAHASAEAVQGWIPCSERLPKEGEVVLITNGKGNVRCGQYRSEHDVRGGTHYWWWKGKTVESVLAWMPRPEPYKGGDDE